MPSNCYACALCSSRYVAVLSHGDEGSKDDVVPQLRFEAGDVIEVEIRDDVWKQVYALNQNLCQYITLQYTQKKKHF